MEFLVKKRIDMKNHFIVCTCLSPEHTLRYIYDEENDELYTEVFLHNHNSFFKRIGIAVKYVFGYVSKYGHFDCTIIAKEEMVKLRTFLGNVK